MKRKMFLGLFIIIVSFLCGCASSYTSKEQFVAVDKKIELRDYAGAILTLESAKDTYYAAKDRVLYYLDLGMLYHLKGDYRKSNELLSKAEDAIEELYTKSASKAAASLLLNDNALDYAGEDYENVYVNVVKAVNYLSLKEFDNAFVEVRRMNSKLGTLGEKYDKLAAEYNSSNDKKIEIKAEKSQFNNSALARALSMLLYRAEDQWDDARLDYNKIKEAWASQSQLYDFPLPNLDNSITVSSKARISVLCFIGKSPQLFANNLTIHTFKDEVAIYTSDGVDKKQLNLFPWYGMTDGYHFKFSLPYMKKSGTEVVRVQVVVDEKVLHSLEPIESLENSAEDTFKSKEKMIYLKTITRTVIKGVLNEKANVELDKKTGGGLMGSLTRAISSVAVDASENADLRLSRYFPAKALICDFEIDPGVHTIKVNYYNTTGLCYTKDFGLQTVQKGKLNFYEATLLK